MTDEEVEKIIKRNMNLQINLAGIRADFEEATQRKPLTDEEITQVFGVGYVAKEFVEFVRAIEAAHGIKENT